MYLFIEFYYRELNILYYYYKLSGHLFIEQKCLRQLICTCRVDFPTIIFQTTGSSSSLQFWRVHYIIWCKRSLVPKKYETWASSPALLKPRGNCYTIFARCATNSQSTTIEKIKSHLRK